MQIISGRSCEFSPALKTALAEYRHKIFVERLGWPLPVEHGLERDQFDHPNTLYVVARESDGAICGCARLLPTTQPYLLGEVFSALLAGGPVPRAHDIWELSRFSAAAADPDSTLNAGITRRDLLAAAVCTAIEHGARRLITVSPLGVERLLYRMGVHAHRAGPPLLVQGKPVFACWIEIDQRTTAALGIASIEHAQPRAGLEYREFAAPALHTAEEEEHF
jgi:acyl homoserine lactone synthase